MQINKQRFMIENDACKFWNMLYNLIQIMLNVTKEYVKKFNKVLTRIVD